MIISHRHIPEDLVLTVRDQIISRVSVAKFLGVYIDDKLSFKCHIDLLCRKISRSVGILYKLSRLVTPQVLLSIYYALVHSHFIYGITSWGGSAASHLNRLSVLQRRALNLVNSLGERNLKILNIECLYKYFCAVKFFKCYVMGEHGYFYEYISNLVPRHHHVTRHIAAGQLNIPLFQKSKCQHSFIYNASKIWNSVPDAVKESLSVKEFKKQYKKYLVGSF